MSSFDIMHVGLSPWPLLWSRVNPLAAAVVIQLLSKWS